MVFWPHAIFTLEISMIMREHIRLYSGIVSLLLICSAAFLFPKQELESTEILGLLFL